MNRLTDRNNITLPEIFDKMREFDTEEKRVEFLISRKQKQMAWYVATLYNFDFQNCYIPEYKPNKYPPDLCNGNIGTNINRIESAITCLRNGDKAKYDKLMTIVLESISHIESQLLEELFDNKKQEDISKDMWRKVYPEFFRPETDTATIQDFF